MKTMYIPKGQSLNYDSLETEHLVVNGVLNVAHGLKARTISGDGLIPIQQIGNRSSYPSSSSLPNRTIRRSHSSFPLHMVNGTCFIACAVCRNTSCSPSPKKPVKVYRFC